MPWRSIGPIPSGFGHLPAATLRRMFPQAFVWDDPPVRRSMRRGRISGVRVDLNHPGSHQRSRQATGVSVPVGGGGVVL